MNTLASLVLTVLMILPVTLDGPRTSGASAPSAVYEDPDGFFSLSYPKTWTLNRAGSEMQFLVDKQGNAGAAVSIQIKSVSAESLADSIMALLAGRRDNLKETNRQAGEVDGYASMWVDYTYTQKTASMQGFLSAVVRNRIGFLTIGWAPKTDYPKLKSAFKDLASSLKIARFDEAPDYDQWKTYQTSHFLFHYLPGTYAAKNIKTIAKDHEKTYADILDALALDGIDRIDFFVYPSKDALYRSTARQDGHANTDASEVHAVWVSAKDHQSLGHEMTHVITAQAIGEPKEALLGEGIAVCLDHSGNDLVAMAKTYYAAGQLLPLSKLLGDTWFKQDAEIAYRESGAFVCYLLDAYSADEFKQAYTADNIEAALKDIYGANLTTLEKRWLKSLLD